ncbi:MAG: ATP-binding protein [Calditrichaeota bacterium]|nr:ATP-binding protein [Calditrichota bacterium]
MTLSNAKAMLVIRSSFDQLQVAVEWTETMAREMGFAEDAVSDLAICVTEAINNAIVHAHRHDARKTIVIRFEQRGEALQVRVLDEGKGFNPGGLADPTLPENVLKESGRGIHIMRHLMDEVKVHAREKGTEIVMWKSKSKETS